MGAFRLDIFSKTRPFIKNRAVNLQNKLIQMPQRYFFSVVVFIFLFCGEILGQEKNVEKIPVFIDNYTNYKGFLVGQAVNGYLIKTPEKSVVSRFNSLKLYPGCGNVPTETRLFIPLNLTQSVLPSEYYVNNLSFFCRKEWQIEKATSIPLRFRLGSLQYTDYLEQKPNSGFRP